MHSLTIFQSGSSGVSARNTKGRLINCVITQCGESGICCSSNGLIELEGDQTKVDGNVTRGGSWNYGLKTYKTSSIIHLLFPLTKESVSTNHFNEHNYGGRGTFQTVETFETFISLSNENERSSPHTLFLSTIYIIYGPSVHVRWYVYYVQIIFNCILVELAKERRKGFCYCCVLCIVYI